MKQSLSFFLYISIAGLFFSCSIKPVAATASINMYICKTATYTCTQTSSTYSADTSGITSCQGNLNQYLPGQTTGTCYPLQSSCQSACKAPPPPATYNCPSKCSGNYDYTKASAYTSTTSNCANPIADTVTYSCDCSCGANSAQHLTFGTCTQQCAQPTAKKMHFCNTVSKSCVETTTPYSDKPACQANLAQFLSGQTTGTCYDTATDCQTACTANATPAPVTTCKTDFCGTTPEVGCLVTCCTKSPGQTRCVTKVGPTPTPDPNAPPEADNPADENQENLPTPDNCACENETCSATCKFDALPDVIYSPEMKCELDTILYTIPVSGENKNKWCTSSKKTLGDADGNGTVNNTDYLYYVSAVNGGKIPPAINPDFNGDGEIGFADRSIIIKSLGGL